MTPWDKCYCYASVINEVTEAQKTQITYPDPQSQQGREVLFIPSWELEFRLWESFPLYPDLRSISCSVPAFIRMPLDHPRYSLGWLSQSLLHIQALKAIKSYSGVFPCRPGSFVLCFESTMALKGSYVWKVMDIWIYGWLACRQVWWYDLEGIVSLPHWLTPLTLFPGDHEVCSYPSARHPATLFLLCPAMDCTVTERKKLVISGYCVLAVRK